MFLADAASNIFEDSSPYITYNVNKSCLSFGGYSMNFQCTYPGSLTGQSMSNLW